MVAPAAAIFSRFVTRQILYIRVMKKRGLLISFEGIDGSGKSTQAQRLREYLQHEGHAVVFIREPGGTEVSEAIRAILLDNRHRGMSPRAELLLFLAARAELVDRVIEPALADGKIVITDRFSDSTYAYQIYGRRLAADVVRQTNQFAANRIKPDLTFVVDLDVPRAQRRLTSAKDRMEADATSFHRRVRSGFLSLAEAEPRRIKLLDGTRTPDELFSQVLQRTLPVLKRRKFVAPAAK